MAQCEPHIFSGITPEQYAALIEKAAAGGITMSGNSGTASKFGVEVSWNYDPASGQLVLQCLDAPFFIGCEQINARLQSLVKESLAAIS